MSTSRSILAVVATVFIASQTFLLAAAEQPKVREPWISSQIHGSPTKPDPYKITAAFPKVRFSNPTSIEQIPKINQLLVTEMSGKLFALEKEESVEAAQLVLDIGAIETNTGGVGLFSATIEPRNKHSLYACYRNSTGQTHVSRFTIQITDQLVIDPKSEKVLLKWPSGGHNGGCLQFGTDGYLYISTGDGSGPNPPDGRDTGQDVSDLLGAILRIDVSQSGASGTYSVPDDNPFVDRKGIRPEIWAYGLRNPWKFATDPTSHEIFVADNGWETWEMVHHIQRGGNCGWPRMEGRALLRPEIPTGPTPIIPPAKDHHHTEANSVIGGPVYRGSKLDGVQGWFVYGDYITGTIWALRQGPNNTYEHQTLVDTDQRIVAFGAGHQGELYVLDYDFTGQIYEILPSKVKDTSDSFPRKLSETGLFRSLKTMEPMAGVVEYDVKIEPWMDGASARRWVAVPGSDSIGLDDSASSASYPDGTVFVKHMTIAIPGDSVPLRLETQILHLEDNLWRPYSYVWNDEGNEATLAELTGANRPIPDLSSTETKSSRTWHTGAQNECKLCHNPGSRVILGFKAEQLDTVGISDSQDKSNQLKQLTNSKVINPLQSDLRKDEIALIEPTNSSLPLDARARSYLHVNCGMCHHPGGNAIVSFYLNRDLPFDKLKTNKGTGVGTFGLHDAKLIVPGDPYRSVLMYRMSKLGFARMPYIGSQSVDSQGISLIEQWIRSMETLADSAASSPLQASSDSAKMLRLLLDDGARADTVKEAIYSVLADTETALALTVLLHQNRVPAKNLAMVLAQAAKSRSEVSGLFEHFIPENQRSKRLGPSIQPQAILSLTGDKARGQLIYFSDNARCISCHSIDNPQKSVGPTLKDISKKYPRRSEMLQHVLQPSLKIEDKFATHAVATTNGKVLVGLILSENNARIELKTADGRVITIPTNTIEEKSKLPKSLMPDMILSDLTAQEAADLLDYVLSLTPQSD